MKKSLLLASLLAALFAGCSTTEVEPMGLNAPFPELESKTADGSGADLSGSGLDADELAELQSSSVLSERSVYFDFDSYAIKAEFENVISAHAEFINRTGARIVLEGNASYEGSHEYNLALGQKRSVAVKDALTALGVNDSNIETVSFGEENANQNCAGSECGQDRRADIKYVGE
ncbi:MAG: OmpA family protein [Methylophilaceae bacterium]